MAFHVLDGHIEAGAINLHRPQFDILLGMDVISQGDLHLKRDGTFIFDFSIFDFS